MKDQGPGVCFSLSGQTLKEMSRAREVGVGRRRVSDENFSPTFFGRCRVFLRSFF